MINVIVLAVVAVILISAIRKVIKNHGNTCDCGCGSCPSCHKEEAKKN